MGCPNFHIMLQPWGGQHRHRWMWFQAIDNACIIALSKINNGLGILVPKENVSTVATADYVLGLWPKEVDSLNSATISVNGKLSYFWIALAVSRIDIHMSFIRMHIFAVLVVATVVEINSSIGIRGKDFAAAMIIHSASDLSYLCLYERNKLNFRNGCKYVTRNTLTSFRSLGVITCTVLGNQRLS